MADDKILIINAKNETLSTSCGPDNKNINGNILLTLNNCEATIANVTSISQVTDVHGLFYNTLIKAQEIKTFDMARIDDASTQHTKLLQHLHLRQFDNTYLIHVLFGLSIVIAIGLVIAMLLFCNMRRMVAVQSATGKSTKPLTFDEVCSQLKLTIEDARLLPPRGVTNQ